jgi:hypothetical protein
MVSIALPSHIIVLKYLQNYKFGIVKRLLVCNENDKFM